MLKARFCRCRIQPTGVLVKYHRYWAAALAAFFSAPGHATTGIGSVAYLWFIGLFFVVVIAIVAVLLRMVRTIRRDSLKHNKDDRE